MAPGSKLLTGRVVGWARAVKGMGPPPSSLLRNGKVAWVFFWRARGSNFIERRGLGRRFIRVLGLEGEVGL